MKTDVASWVQWHTPSCLGNPRQEDHPVPNAWTHILAQFCLGFILEEPRWAGSLKGCSVIYAILNYLTIKRSYILPEVPKVKLDLRIHSRPYTNYPHRSKISSKYSSYSQVRTHEIAHVFEALLGPEQYWAIFPETAWPPDHPRLGPLLLGGPVLVSAWKSPRRQFSGQSPGRQFRQYLLVAWLQSYTW